MKLVAAAKVRRAQEAVLRSRPFSETLERGLCGAYNAAAIKKTEARIEELKAQGIASELVLIGNKGSTYFKKRATPVRKMVPCTQAPTAAQASEIANELLAAYYAGELDRIELLYTSFISMISSMPTVRTLVPLLPSGLEMEG